MKQLQFELWKECNNNCTFCYLGKDNLFTSKEKKLENINKALKVISNKEIYKEYDTLGFIGGEFFQGQLQDIEVHNKFLELFKKVKDLMIEGLVRELWICATLTIGNQKDLHDILDLFKDVEGKIWILTSYDTLGRFHTNKMLETWEDNIRILHEKYPFVLLNTTTIITGDLIQRYLDNEFTFKDLSKKYNTSFFIKLCAGPETWYISKEDTNNKLGEFFPKRKEFLKFLSKFKRQEDSELWDKLFNIKYRADTLLTEYHEEDKIVSRDKETKLETYNPEIDHIMKCGHLSIYNCYLDSDRCALCDKENMKDF